MPERRWRYNDRRICLAALETSKETGLEMSIYVDGIPVFAPMPEPPYEPEGIPFTSNAGIAPMFRVLQRLHDEYLNHFRSVKLRPNGNHNPDPIARDKAWGVGASIRDTRLVSNSNRKT